MPTLYDTKSRLPVTPPAEELEAQLVAGKVAYRKDETVGLVGPDGEAYEVPASSLNDAIAQGYRVETPKQVAVREYLKTTDNARGAVSAALSKFSSEALGGIPELVFDKTADPVDVAKKEALLKQHEFASALGGASGFGASLFVGGPVFKGAAAAGKLAERAVVGGLAERLAAEGVGAGAEAIATTLARRTAGAAARMGVEAGTIAAPYAVTEAALGDPGEAAEHLMANVGIGALLGSAGKLASEGFGAAVSKARAMGAKAAGAVAAGEGGIVDRYIARLDPDMTAIANKTRDLAKADQGLIEGADNVLDAHTRTLTGGLDSVLALKNAIELESFGSGKMAQVKELTKNADMPGLFAPGSVIDRIEAHVKGLLDDPYYLAVDKPRVQRVQKAWDIAQGAMKNGDAADAYAGLYHVKQAIGKEVAASERDLMRNPVQNKMREIYEGDAKAGIASLASEFESPLWGDMGEATKAINQVTAKGLATQNHFEQTFVTNFGKNGFDKVQRADPASIKSYLNGVLGAENDLKSESLAKFLDSIEERARVTGEHYQISPENQKAIADGLASLKTFRSTLAETISDTELVQAVKKRQAIEHAGRIGGLSGLAVDAYSRPLLTIERLVGAEKTVATGRGALAKLFGEWGDNFGTLFTERAMKNNAPMLDAIPELIRTMAARAPKAGIERATQSRPAEVFDKLAPQIRELAANAGATSEATAQLAGPIGQYGAPGVASAYTLAMQRAVAYLDSTMPKPPRQADPFGGVTPRPSDSDMLKWNRRMEIAMNPLNAFKLLADGKLTPDHVDALKTLFPALHSRMQERVQKFAASPEGAKVMLRPEQRAAVMAFAGAPQSSTTFAMQSIYGKAEAHAPSGGKPLKLPDTQTQVQRITSK